LKSATTLTQTVGNNKKSKLRISMNDDNYLNFKIIASIIITFAIVFSFDFISQYVTDLFNFTNQILSTNLIVGILLLASYMLISYLINKTEYNTLLFHITSIIQTAIQGKLILF